jgi:hypothetical protein
LKLFLKPGKEGLLKLEAQGDEYWNRKAGRHKMSQTELA